MYLFNKRYFCLYAWKSNCFSISVCSHKNLAYLDFLSIMEILVFWYLLFFRNGYFVKCTVLLALYAFDNFISLVCIWHRYVLIIVTSILESIKWPSNTCCCHLLLSYHLVHLDPRYGCHCHHQRANMFYRDVKSSSKLILPPKWQITAKRASIFTWFTPPCHFLSIWNNFS